MHVGQARNISRAANRVYDHLRSLGVASIAAVDFADARKIALLLGMDCCRVRHREDFTAELVCDSYGEWTIFYNAHHGEHTRARYLIHEIAEYLAVQDSRNLFDDLPNRVYHYTGGDDPEDARHRIAKRVETLCFRK